MTCDSCGSDRVLGFSAKCSDLGFVDYQGREHDGYIPMGLGIGGGDYCEGDLCLSCGHLNGEWPIAERTVDEAFKSEDREGW